MRYGKLSWPLSSVEVMQLVVDALDVPIINHCIKIKHRKQRKVILMQAEFLGFCPGLKV
jgi:hypothetical protein